MNPRNSLLLTAVLLFASFSSALTSSHWHKNRAKNYFFKQIDKGDTKKVKRIARRHPRFLDLHDEKGYGPLMHAVELKKSKMVQALIERGANVNWQDSEGMTPLMLACRQGDKSTVKVLLETTITTNVNMLANDGKTALLEAVKNNDTASIVRENKEELGRGKYMLGKVASWWHNWTYVDIVKLLIEAKADVNAQDSDGATSLLLAADLGQTSMVKLLLEHKAHVDVQDANGTTPLIAAAKSDAIDSAKALLKAKANRDLQDNDGKTALMYAQEKGYDKLAKLLQESNSDSSQLKTHSAH